MWDELLVSVKIIKRFLLDSIKARISQIYGT